LSRGRNAEYNKKVEEGSGGGKNGFHIFIERITFASALHDIGKVGIQDSRKNADPLTPAVVPCRTSIPV